MATEGNDSYGQDGYTDFELPSGWIDITDSIMRGAPVLYKQSGESLARRIREVKNDNTLSDKQKEEKIKEIRHELRGKVYDDKNMYFKIRGTDRFVMINPDDPEYDGTVPYKFEPVTYDELKKLLPKMDYIGGESKDQRIKAVMKIPGLADKINEMADLHKISRDLLLHRLMKEGFLDQVLQDYNWKTDAVDQPGYMNSLWNREYSGYESFGLDYVGDNLMDGKYSLLDKNSGWWDGGERTDLEGSNGYRTIRHDPYPNDLSSAIDMMAADLKWRQGRMKKKYKPLDDELDIYTNAAYNLGENSKDLKNKNYILKTYKVPSYYKDYDLLNKAAKRKPEPEAQESMEPEYGHSFTDWLKNTVPGFVNGQPVYKFNGYASGGMVDNAQQQDIPAYGPVGELASVRTDPRVLIDRYGTDRIRKVMARLGIGKK